MKNFDIEKLNRKNIYSAPENFFDAVQERVIAEIKATSEPVKKGRLIELNFKYAVAASLVLMGGLVAFFSFDGTASPEPQLAQKTVTESSVPDTAAPAAVAASAVAIKDKNAQPKLLAAEAAIPERKAKTVKNVSEEKESVPVQALSKKAQFEQVMAEIPNTELADMGKGAEQDIYLDLYY